MLINRLSPWLATGAVSGAAWYCWFDYLVTGKG